MRRYSMYSTICKHWQQETSECALKLLRVMSSGLNLFFLCVFYVCPLLQSMAYSTFASTHCRGSLDSNVYVFFFLPPPTDFSGVFKKAKDRLSVCGLDLDSTN